MGKDSSEIRRKYIGMVVGIIEEVKMPQIWLKRRLYDELTKKEINVEGKVDELVEDFLTFLAKEGKGDKNVNG